MQIRNDYSNNVFNGECGTVTLATDDMVNVAFREDFESKEAGTVPNALGHIITYDEKNLVDLMLAYASTCHKSQGAEYSVVFVILDDATGNFLLTRKLLYTAVSRGKKKVYIYASPGCLSKCIKNTSEVPRITKLSWLLKQNSYNKPASSDLLDFDEVPF